MTLEGIVIIMIGAVLIALAAGWIEDTLLHDLHTCQKCGHNDLDCRGENEDE